ncbi:MAG TPA: TolC family protein [Kofleriaceae bacterium]|nr:TolC family protein [Kofleriaceae bacterium]
MNRFTSLVAAVATALGALISTPAAAQPRGRSQAGAPSAAAGAAPADDDGDGPEARGLALFKVDDIIEVAVRLSPDLARARVEREFARESAGAAGRDQGWVMQAGLNFQRDALGADTPDNRLIPLTPLQTDKYTGKLGLARNLPTGGNLSVELGLTHERQEVFLTGENLAMQPGSEPPPQSECGEAPDIFCQDQATARLTFKQPLARGLGSDVALAPQHRADLAAAQATVKAQLAAEEMIRDLVSAYWDLAYTAYEVDVRAESLDLARKQEQVTRQEIRAGTSAPNSLDAVSYEIAIRDEALLVSKLAFEQKSLDLRRKAGLELGRRDILVRPKDPLELDSPEWSIDEVLAQSHRVNRQLATAVLDKRLADVEVDVTHNAMLPQIDLTLSGAVIGTGDTSSAAFSGLGGDSNNGFGYQIVAGVQLSFDLSGAARSAHAAALAKRHGADIARVDLERQIDAKIVASVKTLMSGRTRVALSDKAIAIAEDNVKTERAQFLAQRSNNFQVMTRQTQLIDARLRRGRAVTDYRVAVAQLQYLSGTLLDAYRIRVRTARADVGTARAERGE